MIGHKFPLAHRVNMTHKYTPSVATDIRKTFAKARKAAAQAKPAPAPNVATLRQVKP